MYAEKTDYDDIEMSSRLRNILRRNGFESLEGLREYPKEYFEYSCAMKSHFRKIGNQMSGSGNHLCEFTRVMFYLDRIPLASICHVQHQCL